MSAETNLMKALSRIDKYEKYIEQLEASGYKLPEVYDRLKNEMNEIKNNPNRKGIQANALSKVEYWFDKRRINSFAKLDTSMTINRIGNINPFETKYKKSQKSDKLQEYSDKMNDIVNEYLDKVDMKNYPNSLPTLQAKRVMQEAQMLGFDIRDIDYTKLADIGSESLRTRTILKDIEMMLSNAPAHISPFKEQIYKQIGEQNHVKFLTNMAFSNSDISL